MSGVTDRPFREIAARAGAGMVVSEMVASEQLALGDAEAAMRADTAGVTPHVIQLAGREAHWMAEGARAAERAGADIIDINMGCPAKKVTSGYSGSALMRDLDHALRLIEATVSATDRPVTLKMRLGWDESSLNAPELAARAEAAGVQMITVHGRTRCQFYNGSADWAAVAAVRAAIRVPLVVNGDVGDLASAERALGLSGADAVMVGRAAYGRPHLAGALAAAAAGQEVPPTSAAAIADGATAHYEAMLTHYGTALGVRMARKHLGWYLERLAEAGADVPPALRQAVLTHTDPGAVIGLLGEAGAAVRRAA